MNKSEVMKLATAYARLQVVHSSQLAHNAPYEIEAQIKQRVTQQIVYDKMEYARGLYDDAFRKWAAEGYPE